jgi:hypothetical protein
MHTLSGRPFRLKVHPDGELIVYPCDRSRKVQDRWAVAITPYLLDLVTRAIQDRGTVLMGASRDAPPAGSLGALVKGEGQSPQNLSYLVPVLVERGVCTVSKRGRAFVLHRKAP